MYWQQYLIPFQGELSAALAHEVGHVIAGDNLKRGLLRACRDTLLIIPSGRRLDAAWKEASEAAADEYAAARDRMVGLDLASALVKIARLVPVGSRPTLPAGAYFVCGEDPSGFKARVRNLVKLAGSGQLNLPRFRDRKTTGVGSDAILVLLLAAISIGLMSFYLHMHLSRRRLPAERSAPRPPVIYEA